MEGLRNPSDVPGTPALPSWVKEFRPHQIEAIAEIQEHYARGVKVVFLDAPTGSGKTLIGETVRRLQDTRSVYLCSSITLQDQFVKDYPYARVLKGRSNYPTLDKPERFRPERGISISGADCTKTRTLLPACETCSTKDADAAIDDPAALYPHCDFCHPWQDCPYEEAKGDAMFAKLAVINSTYFLTESNYVGRFGQQFIDGTPVGWSHPFVIIDEADVLEDELMRFVEWKLSARMMGQLDIAWPEKKTIADSWIDWAVNEAGPKLKEEVGRLRGESVDLRERGASTDRLVRVLKRLKTLTGLEAQLREIGPRLGEGWVYTGYERPESKYAGVTFKPVKVDQFGQSTIWRHGEKFLLMSATVISPEQMAEDLGLGPDEYASVWVQSGFPVENRPVYVRPRARMTAKTKDESYPKMVDAIQQVLDAHPTERTLIHTVSYALTDHLESNLSRRNFDRPILSYSSSAARAFALQRYQEQEAAVLLAPSFERGVDLPDDLGRVVIVAKLPYPYLGDKQVNQRLRMHGGQRWYTMQTVRSIVQMSGRAMRHEDDRCSIYILDSMFMKLWKESRHLFPKWWKDAIIWQP